ncbi:DUF6691 family protein [Sphingorhabdus lutea]
MSLVIGLIAGMLFGGGLAYSGMADPARVRGFLDIFGHWDPTLAFVMFGALLPMAGAWQIQKLMKRPFADVQFSLPDTKKIDRKLVIGAILFGAGWGISGLCPGPGFAGIALNPAPALTFVAALLLGMVAHKFST